MRRANPSPPRPATPGARPPGPSARTLWLLLPGGRPVPASETGRAAIREARYYCYEGATEWRPIEDLIGEGGPS